MLRSCDPRLKLLFGALALALALAAPRPVTPLLLALAAATSLVCDGRASRASLGRLLRPLGGLAITAGLPALLVGWYRGPADAAALGARVLGASAVSVWLVRSTQIDRLQAALVSLGVSRALVELLGLSHRYVGVFRQVLFAARDAQTMRLGYVGLRRSLGSVGVLTGVVFTRAIDQTAILSDAMALRGYQGQLVVPLPAPLGRVDALFAGASTLVLGACALGGWSALWSPLW